MALSLQDHESEEKFSISDDRISHLLPTYCQDMIVRVYSKKPELVSFIKFLMLLHSSAIQLQYKCKLFLPFQVGVISDAFENFQLKTYGIKAQVHATPEKKKRRT